MMEVIRLIDFLKSLPCVYFGDKKVEIGVIDVNELILQPIGNYRYHLISEEYFWHMGLEGGTLENPIIVEYNDLLYQLSLSSYYSTILKYKITFLDLVLL